MGHSKRKENSIKLRQPLAKITYLNLEKLPPDLEEIIKDELNVKSVGFKNGKELAIELDINISEDLKKEGEAREIIRNIQKLRKEQGLTLNDAINLTLPSWPEEFKDVILKSTHSVSVTQGEEIKIELVS
jgi:isoleucyl-tRNA synthetase